MSSVQPGPPSLHLPFDPGPYRMTMGLIAMPEANWIEIDHHYADQIALRRRLLTEQREEVFAGLPGGMVERRDLLATLVSHVCAHHPGWFIREGAVLHNRLDGTRWDLDDLADDPLVVAGQLVQEDLLLLRQEKDSTGGDILRLTSAVLCFPGRWRLAEKVGKPLGPIHGPVPMYQDRLARPVDRFLSLLKRGRLAMRMNWSILDDPALFQPTGHGRAGLNPDITPDTAGQMLVLRVERQTFRRLAESDAVVFGIHTHVTKLADVVAHPGEAAKLAQAVRALPEAMERYKSLLPFRTALLAYLDRVDTEVSRRWAATR
jgi:dimethylamine monooxygenase subunit A